MQETELKIEDKEDGNSLFGHTTKYIADELNLIHDQQENIVTMSKQLEKALSQADRISKLMKTVKKIDRIVLKNIETKRKDESGMLHVIEDLKRLVSEQKFEGVDHLMHAIQNKSQEKLRLSQKELHELRKLIQDLNEAYQEAVGFSRLYQLLYEKLAHTYETCKEELETELTEEEDLHKAGSYTGEGENRIVRGYSFKTLLSNGIQRWLSRF